MMKKIYIVLFSILYVCIAVIGCIHAYEFFGLATSLLRVRGGEKILKENQKIMAAVLSGAFEVGQAAVLFALLTSEKERNKIMPWVLMVIFTLVQIMGNIYACYKHIMLYSQDLLQYFKEPIFIWTNLPDAQATVIVTYVVAAILPICGLLLTSMVTNFLDKDTNKVKNEEQKVEKKEEKILEENKEIENELPTNEPEKIEEVVEDEIEQEDDLVDDPTETPTETPTEKPTEIPTEEVKIPKDVEDIMDGNIVPHINYPNNQKSHFVNI